MKNGMTFLWIALGAVIGSIVSQMYFGPVKPVSAGDSRYEDYIMCTGQVLVPARKRQTDGLWLLDYRAGKLLGTVIDRNTGKIVGWAEVDLTRQFKIQPKQNVHFMMTTGTITDGQAALYLAETVTGQLGVYTMGPGPVAGGVAIRQHDLVYFRKPKKK